jgi:protease-4
MALTADHLLDRLRLKQQITKWRSLSILLILLVGILFAGSLTGEGVVTLPQDYIARVTIEDIITTDKDRDEILARLRKDDNVKALIVKINSPGGTIVGGETLHDSIKAFSEAKKPVVILMQDIAASGGYMAAVAGDRIFAHSGTLTGSIGVLLQSADITELGEKIGVKFQTFKSAELKAVPSPFEKLTPKGEQVIQATIMDAYQTFVDLVVAGRPALTRQQIEALADGRVYTGRQALKVGLIDELGDEDAARTWLEKNYKISSSVKAYDVKLDKDKKGLDKILGSFVGNWLPVHQQTRTPALMALWVPEQY